MSLYEKQPLRVKPAKSGDWAIEEFEVDEHGARFHNLRAQGGRGITVGTYTRLRKTSGMRDVVMSDTPAEIRDHHEFIREAKGKVLINGLGIGVILEILLKKEEVEHITVIEKSEDVIKMVAPYYEDEERVTIIHADALEYQPPKGVRYDVVWHDIWTNICSDNLDDMKKLHRKYGRRCDWQGSWCRGECERQKRQSWW